MDEERERRIGSNEALFREANEAIERGLWPEQERQIVRFRCECASACGEAVELRPSDYERVRRDGRKFIVLDGHQLPEVEEVVERHAEYLVVRKRGASGETAEALDPRD